VHGEHASRPNEDGAAVPREILRVADGLRHRALIVVMRAILALPFK
jgi:hypothetical protein